MGKENLLQTIGVNVLTPRGKRVCFSERVAFCFSKATIGGEENEGGGRGKRLFRGGCCFRSFWRKGKWVLDGEPIGVQKGP